MSRRPLFSIVLFLAALMLYRPLPADGQVAVQRVSGDSSHIQLALVFPEISGKFLPRIEEKLFLKSRSRVLDISVTALNTAPLAESVQYILPDEPIGEAPSAADRILPEALSTQCWRLEPAREAEDAFYHCLTVTSLFQHRGTTSRLISCQINVRGERVQRVQNRVEAVQIDAAALPVLSKSQAFSSGMPDRDPAWQPLQLHVDSTRVVWISRSLLMKTGWSTQGLDPRRLRVSCRGRELPVTVIGEEDGTLDQGDGLLFYAEPLWLVDSAGMKQQPAYVHDSVYWIDVKAQPGLRLAQKAAFGVPRPAWNTRYPRSAPQTRHFEENTIFHRLPYAIQVSTENHWLWGWGIIGGEKQERAFTLPAPDAFALHSVSLRIRLWGQTQMEGVHEVDVFLNNTFVGSGSWQGREHIRIESQEISPSALLESGRQTLTLVNKSTQGALAQLYVDGFEITYPRLLQAEADALHFHAPPHTEGQWVRYEIEGFTSPDIHVMRPGVADFYGGRIVPQEDSTGTVTYTLTFEDEVVDPQWDYVAYAAPHRWSPDSLIVYEPIDPVEAAAQSDYIVIVPHDSLGTEILQPLLDLRTAQGHRTAVVTFQSLIDACNHGMAHPAAIRNFLSLLYQRDPQMQRYVLLVGDGHVDYHRNAEQGNLLPVPVYPTEKYGGAAADHWYVCLAGDDALAEMAIGRLPVTHAEQLRLVVDKLVDYGRNARGEWRNRYLLIGSGGHQDIFRKQSEELIKTVFSPALEPRRLYLSGPLSDPYVGGTEDLLRQMRDGVAMINFRGHGGGAIWADAGLLDLDDIALLENRHKLPFVTSMTCFTADFSSSRQCLGEALLTETEAGVAAFWGASGVGWVYNDYYLLRELQSGIAAQPHLPVGALIQEAKTCYSMQHSGPLALGEVYQYNFLGDPAMRLAVPVEDFNLTLDSRALSPGDPVVCTGEGESPLRLEAALTEAHGRRYANSTFNPGSASWQIEMTVPESQSATEHGLRVYGWDENSSTQAHGYAPFRVQRAWFDSLGLSPAHPKPDSSFAIVADIEARQGVRRAWCQLFAPAADSLPMLYAQTPGRYRTDTVLGPLPPASLLSFAIGVIDGDGQVSRSDTVIIRLPTAMDLCMRSVDFDAAGALQLSAAVQNVGDSDVHGVEVLFTSPALEWTARDTVAVPGGSTAHATVHYAPWMGTAAITATVDPMGAWTESRRDNNSITRLLENAQFLITAQKGSELNGVGPVSVGIPSQVLVHVPAGAVGDTVLWRATAVVDQPQTWKVTLRHEHAPVVLNRQGQLSFFKTAEDSSALCRVYRYESALDRWVAAEGAYTDSTLSIPFTQGGRYRLSASTDQTPPHIEIQVAGQPLTENGYVSSRALISVILNDVSGVDARQDQIELYLDDQRLPSSVIVMADTLSDPVQVVFTMRPQLTPGPHALRIGAADVHGNYVQSDALNFRVGQGLEIEYLGNHPNPFKRETVFAYLLTDAAEKALLKIYTVDGRLIRSFDRFDMASADYHEVVWDGLDNWGEPVANGVYFFRIQVKSAGRTREFTGKIAKVR